MLHLTENKDEMILRDVPFGRWIIGIFLLFIFGVIAIALTASLLESPRAFFSSMNGGWLGSIFAVLMFILLIGLVLLMFAAAASFILSPVITTTIERNSQHIEILRRGLLQNKKGKFFFTQIKGFGANKVTFRGAAMFSAVLILKNDTQIELETNQHLKSDVDETIEKLNSFIKPAK